jgi:hypothetical protein
MATFSFAPGRQHGLLVFSLLGPCWARRPCFQLDTMIEEP